MRASGKASPALARREIFECKRAGGQPAPRPAQRHDGGGIGRFPLLAAPPEEAAAGRGAHKLSILTAGCGGAGTLLPPSPQGAGGPACAENPPHPRPRVRPRRHFAPPSRAGPRCAAEGELSGLTGKGDPEMPPSQAPRPRRPCGWKRLTLRPCS